MSQGHKTRRRNTILGVALIEMLLSVTIIGIGLGVSFRTLSLGLGTQSRLETRMTGRRLAEQKLIELRGTPGAGQQGELTGSFPEPYSEYGWSATASSSSNEVNPFQLLELKVWRGKETHYVYSSHNLILPR